MKAVVSRAAKAVRDYLFHSPKAHAAMVSIAIGVIEAVRSAIGHP